MNANADSGLLDTPICLLTPRQLFEAMELWQTLRPAAAKGEERRYAHSVKELADALGTSASTVYRMKAAGLLDEATAQYGRAWVRFDVDKVAERFRLAPASAAARKRKAV